MAVRNDVQQLTDNFLKIRLFSEKIVQPLEREDFVIQAIPDVSPPKWHLAHTTWFFETFILKKYASNYKEFHSSYNYLFNSYYETIGTFFPRHSRGLLSRPSVDEIRAYRQYVDEQIVLLLQRSSNEELQKISMLLTLGLNHEQQHQELLLTDIKFNFSINPLQPTYQNKDFENVPLKEPSMFHYIKGGLIEIGHNEEKFSFDNERPVHKVWLEPYHLSSHPVTNREFIEFIEDRGYEKAEYWLSDGWAMVKKEKWSAPLYWIKEAVGWSYFTLSGRKKINLDEPVSHVSFYEADAFARWAGKRLPTEGEWEHAMQGAELDGNFADSGRFHPIAGTVSSKGIFRKAFGDVWEWTASPYSPYPGSERLEGALGEYNAKFMANQMVLRGGSCVTSADHIRVTYRNFFQPEKRWQFSGFRLAEDGQ